MNKKDKQSGQLDKKICSYCLFANSIDKEFCEDCGILFDENHQDGTLETLNLERKYDKRSGKLVFIGSLVFYLSLIFLMIFVAVGMLFKYQGGGTENFIFFWLFVGLAFLLYKLLSSSVTEYYKQPESTEEK